MLRNYHCVAIAVITVAIGGTPLVRGAELIDASIGVQQLCGQFSVTGSIGTTELPASATVVTFVITFQYLDGEKWKDAGDPAQSTIRSTIPNNPRRVKADTGYFHFKPAAGQKWRVHVHGHFQDANGKHDFKPVMSGAIQPRP